MKIPRYITILLLGAALMACDKCNNDLTKHPEQIYTPIEGNEIWYTSFDGNIIDEIDALAFSATILSHTYNDNKGVITFDSDIYSILKRAFMPTHALKTITLPPTLQNIQRGVFDGCSNLESVIFNGEITSIGSYAFNNCHSLKEVIGSQSIVLIDDYAFNGCSMLSNITLGPKINRIGAYGFKDCGSITALELMDFTQVDEGAFNGCRKLEHINIPANSKYIRQGTFAFCTSLAKIDIPEGILYIEPHAFYLCSSLREVTLPNGLKELEEGAFASSGIESITIPANITTIKNDMFSNCYNLNNVVMHDDITLIELNAFYACHSLKEIRLPASLYYIGDNNFSECISLTKVYFTSITPPYLGEQIFYGTPNTRKLYVPNVALEAYTNSPTWEKYIPYIEGYDI